MSPWARFRFRLCLRDYHSPSSEVRRTPRCRWNSLQTIEYKTTTVRRRHTLGVGTLDFWSQWSLAVEHVNVVLVCSTSRCRQQRDCRNVNMYDSTCFDGRQGSRCVRRLLSNNLHGKYFFVCLQVAQPGATVLGFQ